MFFYEVNSRDKTTLHHLIGMNIEKGGNVVSDMRRSYIGLDEKGYQHYTVNHKYNFVNPVSGKHTQLIEGLCNLAKKKIHRDFGINRKNLQKYLDLFALRRCFNRKFSYFINTLF
ncbi:hypothetical protein DMUE_3960 [Dictyocoela muelleri]|nr:hypothetical protein DMUE_3960 [Dictyocoela muelleri]